MKKVIILILIALPIFLMITISVTGRIIVMYVPIPVESVHFADEQGEPIEEMVIGKGHTVKVNTVVLPDLATNKKVTYTILNNNINDPVITLNQETGEITGMKYASARLVVTTDDKKLRAELLVTVNDSFVSEVTLNKTELTLNIGQSERLLPTILPATAINKSITWSSSDPEKVSVGVNGTVRALAETTEPVIVTVTTEDGGFTASCEVTVLPNLPALAFYRPSEPDEPVDPSTEVIIVNTPTIDLKDYLLINSVLFEFSDITITKTFGDGTLNGDFVTFPTVNSQITLSATVTVTTDTGEVTYTASATIRYRPI